MNSKELTSLAFKILAIYVLVTLLSQIGQFTVFFRDFFQYDSTWFFLIPILSIGLPAALFFLLWNLSNKVIQSTVESKNDSEDLKVDQFFILSLVGFYLLPQGIIELSNELILNYVNNSVNSYLVNTSSTQMMILHVAASLIKIIISLSLIFKTKGWVHLFKKVRYMGR